MVDAHVCGNHEINRRKLQCNADKCHRMHVGKKENCESIYIESWKKEKEYVDGKVTLKDTHGGKNAIDTVKEQIYLGENISTDASNKGNVEIKIAKGKGVISEIIYILNNIYLGAYFFKMLTLSRESLFISVITSQSEVWINVTEKELMQLEALDSLLLSRALLSSSKTSQCIMLLELGMKPIRYYISSMIWITLTQFQMSKPSIKFPLFFPKWAFKILVHPLLA